MEPSIKNFVRRFEWVILPALFVWGSWFLLRMAWLHVFHSTLICVAYLAAIYYYVKIRFDLKIPLLLMFMVYLTVALDGWGNYFGLYNMKFRYAQYDEFTHAAVPALAMPLIVWLLREGMKYFGYRLPLGLVAFFAITTAFTLSGFYEVIELWDDKYMHPVPGTRIHGPYDTANDLQNDLIGLIIGGLIAYVILKKNETGKRNAEHTE